MNHEYELLSFLVALAVMACAWIFRKSISRLPAARLLLVSLSFFALRAASIFLAMVLEMQGMALVGDCFLLLSIALLTYWSWIAFVRRTD